MTAYILCSECGVRVNLRRRKDRESFTGDEALAHFRAKHPEQVSDFGYPYQTVRLEAKR